MFMIVRLFLGLRWLIAGMSKFSGPDGSLAFSHFYDEKAVGMMAQFTEKTFLPKILLWPYIYSLPHIELALGVGLLLGLWTRWVLILTGLLYVSLAFGQMLVAGHGTVHAIAAHLILVVIALHLLKYNRWALIPDRN